MSLKFSSLRGNRLSVGKSIERCGSREIVSPKTPSSDRILRLGVFMRFKMLLRKVVW